MTAEDFERLTLAASNEVARAICVAPPAGGVVRVHLLPRVEPADRRLELAELTPSEALMSTVARTLDRRRLLGTSIRLLPARLRGVSVVADVRASPRADIDRVQYDVEHALYVYLNPLIGGSPTGPGPGWPAGRALNPGELFGIVYAIDGVEFVNILRMYETDIVSGSQAAQPTDSPRVGKVKTKADYLVAGRSLPAFVLVFTLLSSWIGSGSLLGGAENAYRNGFAALWQSAGGWAGLVLIYFIAPRARKFAQFTIPDLLEARYNQTARVLGVIAVLFTYTAITSYQFIGGGDILHLIFPGIAPQTGQYIIAAFVIVFTAIAGMSSVAYMDVAIGLLATVTLLVTLPVLLHSVGGWAGVHPFPRRIQQRQRHTHQHQRHFDRSCHTPSPIRKPAAHPAGRAVASKPGAENLGSARRGRL